MGNIRPGVVVVGTGFGARIHVPAARLAGLEVVALVGRDPERTRRRADRLGIGAACSSLEEALCLPRSDVVVIATPPATHAALAEEAIAAGRPVLVEKPFALDVEEARRLEAAARAAGVVALVGHEFRFAPERVTMQHVVRTGLLGVPRMATLVGHMPLAAPVDMRAPDWWFDPSRGGGWLGAAVSHLVDAVRCWLGEVESVSAVLPMVSERDPSTHAEDSVSARLRMRSGCEVALQQSAAVWGPPVQLVRISGPVGSAEIIDGDVLLSTADGSRVLDPAGPPVPVAVGTSDDPRHRFTHLELGPAAVQMSVFDDLVAGREVRYQAVKPATFADGVAVTGVLDAIRRSARDGGVLVHVQS
ncbi:Gfo/Idh/MocA family protein [Blastococcus sp. URHD0036]|uniref:Gfo/Idh/MocA family protein n=1 Tax=Blastococcus sp. URHD0036 TaxID=1380356 RepID=UPI00049848F2|nr:Gfo/Idh/MocA family oxidoreductase [Blastococcus sp. URHD0036]